MVSELRSEEERWIPIPNTSVVDEVEFFVWLGFEIKLSAKGYSIFSTTTHEGGLMLPYGGFEILKASYNTLARSGDEPRMSYLSNGRFNRKNEVCSWLDAHPSIYPVDLPKHAWVGSLVNEPSYGERVNCRLYLQPRSKALAADMPNYPSILRYPAVDKVVSGQELLVDYGWDKSHRAALGYKIFGRGFPWKQKSAFVSNDKIKVRKAKENEYMAMVRDSKRKKRLEDDASLLLSLLRKEYQDTEDIASLLLLLRKEDERGHCVI